MATNPIADNSRPVTPLQAGVILPHEVVRKYAEALIGMANVASSLGQDLIERLDVLDGDPDIEANGDDELSGDERDAGWNEWHARGGFQRFTSEAPQTLNFDDDAEDDDPAGGAIDDEPHDPEGDFDTEEGIPGGGGGV